ncbi:UPF0042 nucleotide-binding protein [Natranaerovirga pectinivora]|uniref:UPF0042 nucleotide-binding protein n=1 Tax=Natranaerovirga pectinivora TaxID=682400 RepID=A0A4R3MPM4_9FIRM|nr:RNase adapter RapZ [Natranaerovirga pectinivora]TCT14225.1 UPF0042 nucleotide-binding protein [Natranaerovirga pectinivora]
MRFVIVTGMSGAGKSTALKMLEDVGFFCVDNLPTLLIKKFAELCFKANSGIDKVALGIDIRSGKDFNELFEDLKEIKENGLNYEVLFLDSSDEILVKRYKETRRKHPLMGDGRIQDGISMEREILKYVKEKSNYIIDTSNLLTRELKSELNKIFIEDKSYSSLYITVLSFGFKYGIPSDSDLVYDVRFIPNPYYIPELRPKTGEDQIIQDYVMNWDVSQKFLDKLDDMLSFLIPNYIQEGKNQLVISIGCTGGKHRSVTLTNEIFKRLSKYDYSIKKFHRDIDKDKKSKEM